MKLEVGKFYKTRDGRKVGPIKSNNHVNDYWAFKCDDMYFRNGGKSCRVFGDVMHARELGQHDLIAEWTDTPTIGTLAEIGAQVGDVVSWLNDGVDDGDHHHVTGGADMYGDTFSYPHMQLSANYCVPMQHQDYQFRIVSRASDYQPSVSECIEAAMAKGIDYPAPSPVRTVTRKEIVPGVYGKVEVTDLGNIWMQPTMSRADLIAARDVFSQLIDAMPYSA